MVSIMTFLTIGIGLVVGGGLFWCFGGAIDCSTLHGDGQIRCTNMVHLTNYGLVVMICGFFVLPFIFIFPDENKTVTTSPRKEIVESPHKTLPIGFTKKSITDPQQDRSNV